jgi:hypothetical protein
MTLYPLFTPHLPRLTAVTVGTLYYAGTATTMTTTATTITPTMTTTMTIGTKDAGDKAQEKDKGELE